MLNCNSIYQIIMLLIISRSFTAGKSPKAAKETVTFVWIAFGFEPSSFFKNRMTFLRPSELWKCLTKDALLDSFTTSLFNHFFSRHICPSSVATRILLALPYSPYKKDTTRIIAKMALAKTFISKEKKRCHHSFILFVFKRMAKVCYYYISSFESPASVFSQRHTAAAAALAGRSNTTRINRPKTSILFWKGAAAVHANFWGCNCYIDTESSLECIMNTGSIAS